MYCKYKGKVNFSIINFRGDYIAKYLEFIRLIFLSFQFETLAHLRHSSLLLGAMT